MKVRALFLSAALAGVALLAGATTGLHKQILVFRNNGTTDMFYADRINSIELSRFDADSLYHAEYVSQVFREHTGKTVVIPIAEIDSVVFGSRNIIEPKEGVRKLTDEEVSAITDFNPESITYRSAGFPRLSLIAGELIYYDKITDMMPYGLNARVKSIDSKGSESVAKIEYVAPEDMFDKMFVSESDEIAPEICAPAEDDIGNGIFEIRLPKTELNNTVVEAEAKLIMSVKLEETFGNFMTHNYHGVIKMHIGPELKVGAYSTDSREATVESDAIRLLRLLVQANTMSLTIEGSLFAEILAELGLEYEYSSGIDVEIEWTRSNGQDTFSQPIVKVGQDGSRQKAEVHLKGELFFGVDLTSYIGVLFDRIGVCTSLKIGPDIKADFSLGVLQELEQEFNESAYGRAQLELALRAKMETFWYNREQIFFGDRQFHKLPFMFDIPFPLRTINLFPEYDSRSTFGKSASGLAQTPSAPKAIDIAVSTETQVPIELEQGFELVDKKTGDTIAQIFREEDVVKAESKERQIFNAEFVLTDALADVKPESVMTCPVFKYKGYVIKGCPSYVASNVAIQPITYTGAAKNRYVVMGNTPVGQTTSMGTTLITGNHLPYGDLMGKFKRTVKTVSLLGDGSGGALWNLLLGTWKCNSDGETVILTFHDMTNGEYNGIHFKYAMDQPTAGAITIRMDDGATITLFVEELTASLLVSHNKTYKQYIFTR